MSDVVTKELPDKWEIVPLSDFLIEFESGTRPKGGVGKYTEGVPSIGAEHLNADGGFKFEKIKFVPEEFAATMKRGHLQEGDILVVKDGATTAKTSLVRKSFPYEKAVINEHVFRCKVDEYIVPEYVFYYLYSGKGKKEILTDFRGVAQGGISTGFTNKVRVPLAPPEQQKRLVAKIEELFSHIDAGIKALKKAKQLLKQYRQSVLKAAVTGELTKQWREENKDTLEPASQLLEHIESHRNKWLDQQISEGSSEAKRLRNKLKKHEFDAIERKYIPEGWVSVSLLKLCQAVVDCHNKTAPYVDKGIPLIRTTNIRHGAINFEHKMKYITEETYDYWSRRCPPESGDIFFTREAPMGESAIVPDKVRLCMGQRMMLLRPFHQFTDVRYLHIALMEPLFQSRFQNFKVGVGVQHLRVGDVEKSVVALPPIEEQKIIVRLAFDRLDAIERIESDIALQLKKAEKNKQAILASVFSGQFN